MTEHRHTHRVKFDSLIEFEINACSYKCELVDISLQGALIAAYSGAASTADTPCKITITLDATEEHKIIMFGRVVRKIENRLGIHCDSIDVDSMTHLRRLIEFNLGDVELVNRDLDSLFHDHRSLV